MQLQREGVRLHFGVYIHHRSLGLENNRNRVDDESMDVGDSSGVDDTKLLVVEALEGRESLMQEVVDCLIVMTSVIMTLSIEKHSTELKCLPQFDVQLGLFRWLALLPTNS